MPPASEAGPAIYESHNLEEPYIDPYALGLPSEASPFPESKESRQRQEEIAQWSKTVAELRAETVALRDNLESRLKAQLSWRGVTEEAEARHRAEIDRIVNRGLQREYTYNPSGNPRWNRTQTYYLTIDPFGNVWGNFEPAPTEIGITGQPLPPGMHLMCKNPTL